MATDDDDDDDDDHTYWTRPPHQSDERRLFFCSADMARLQSMQRVTYAVTALVPGHSPSMRLARLGPLLLFQPRAKQLAGGRLVHE